MLFHPKLYNSTIIQPAKIMQFRFYIRQWNDLRTIWFEILIQQVGTTQADSVLGILMNHPKMKTIFIRTESGETHSSHLVE